MNSTIKNKLLLWDCNFRLSSNLSAIDADQYKILTVKEIVWSYILPVICLFGVASNAISFRIFLNNKDHFKHVIYKYLTVHCFLEVIYLSLSLVYFLLKSKHIGAYICHSFPVKVFELCSHLFLTSVLALLMVFVEFVISLKRLLVIFRLNLTPNFDFYKTILIYFLVSLLIHIPIPFAFKIVPISDHSMNGGVLNKYQKYDISYAEFEYSRVLKSILYIPALIRGFILPLVLMITNLAIYVDFKKSLNRMQNFRHASTDSNVIYYFYLYNYNK